MGTMTEVIDTIAALRLELDAVRASGRTVALVATLGALHDGHLAHVARASELADVVVVSVFVNPTQFGANEDLAKYPRDLDGDVAKLAPLGVDYVFAPSVEQMYPFGPTETTISAGKVGTMFEGKARPGHFNGVLTVVAKLLHIVQPSVATFGQKDAQQLFLVRRMVAELNIPTRIETIETVREPDGLALSSRNRYLSLSERKAARTPVDRLGRRAGIRRPRHRCGARRRPGCTHGGGAGRARLLRGGAPAHVPPGG